MKFADGSCRVHWLYCLKTQRLVRKLTHRPVEGWRPPLKQPDSPGLGFSCGHILKPSDNSHKKQDFNCERLSQPPRSHIRATIVASWLGSQKKFPANDRLRIESNAFWTLLISGIPNIPSSPKPTRSPCLPKLPARRAVFLTRVRQRRRPSSLCRTKT